MGEDERGEVVPRRTVSYFCAGGHEKVLRFALDVEPPPTWDCPNCGLPASQDRDAPPGALQAQPYKTHLAYVKERRSDDEAAQILTEALQTLRDRRKSGEIIF